MLPRSGRTPAAVIPDLAILREGDSVAVLAGRAGHAVRTQYIQYTPLNCGAWRTVGWEVVTGAVPIVWTFIGGWSSLDLVIRAEVASHAGRRVIKEPLLVAVVPGVAVLALLEASKAKRRIERPQGTGDSVFATMRTILALPAL